MCSRLTYYLRPTVSRDRLISCDVIISALTSTMSTFFGL